MSPSQARPQQTKTITTQVLLNKNWSKWQQPSSKELKQYKVAKPASKESPLTPARPRYSSKRLSHSLRLLRQGFTALQDTWNHLCALTLLPTTLEEFMTPLPNWNQFPLPAEDTIPPHLLPLPALPQMSWNDFLCLHDIELSTRQPVCGTNAKPRWKERTATTTPLDHAIYLPLAPCTPLHGLSPLFTPSADLRIDGPSLLPLLAKMDTLASTLSSTEVADQRQTI